MSADLAALLPLRNVPIFGALLSLGLLAMSVLGPLGLIVAGMREEDVLAVLLGAPVFALLAIYGLYRSWRNWTTLQLDGDALLWRGGRQQHRFPPEAVVGVEIDHFYARRRVFFPAVITLQLDGPDLPNSVQIGHYRFAGAGLLQRTYRLAHALGVRVSDPTGHRHRTRFPLPMRWLGEGRDWMAFLLVSGVLWPMLTLLTGNLVVIVVAFAVGLAVSAVTLVVGYRPLDLDD